MATTPPNPHDSPDTVRLDSLELTLMSIDWGIPRAGKSIDGNPLSIGGRKFEHGVGAHANQEFNIDLKNAARRFEAWVGVDDEVGDRGSIVFVVVVDGNEAARTGIMRGGDKPKHLKVDLSGVKRLTLVVEDGGDDIHYDHADWGDARILMAPASAVRPSAVGPPPEPAPDIATHTAPKPAINAPRITGATPGRPFLFKIPATGKGPLKFSADNLPSGLSLDSNTGIISGALKAAGKTEVKIKASGPAGEAASTLTIVGGKHKLALTPPMGWNSWNVWGTSVDEDKVRAAADWMVKSGLAAHGYQYINIDDAWEAGRDEDGRIQTNEKFPDMKALADYVHTRGLKLGIYSSPGPKTCAGYEGSYKHEKLDAQTWAEWGIDLVKYDWCSYGKIAKDDSREELMKPYRVMREALDVCGRDIVYSLCQYGMGNVSQWGAKVGGNYWRTTGDITDTWSSMAGIGFSQAGLEAYAGPGHWNDPDMLVVGKVGWGPELHATRLTKNEQVTHITLWSMLASPLLIGCDLSQMDEFTLAVLTNPEVLEVNQDPLGKQARRAWTHEKFEAWTRPLHDGSTAVALFNRGRAAGKIKVQWKDIGLKPQCSVRDLWKRSDLGEHDKSFETEIARHGAVMLKVRAISR